MKKTTYITKIIDILQIEDFYGVSETIDIAKGKHQLPSNWKGIVNTIKRNKK